MRNFEMVVKNELKMDADLKKILLYIISKIDKSNLVYPITVVLPFSEIEKKAGKMKVEWEGVDNFTHQLAKTVLYFNTKAPLCSLAVFKEINTYHENDVGYCRVVFNNEFIKRYI